jgi:hypothetical protein
VLKNYGCHLENNYGHDQHYPSTVLVMLNLLAFLIHTALDLTADKYRLSAKSSVPAVPSSTIYAP